MVVPPPPASGGGDIALAVAAAFVCCGVAAGMRWLQAYRAARRGSRLRQRLRANVPDSELLRPRQQRALSWPYRAYSYSLGLIDVAYAAATAIKMRLQRRAVFRKGVGTAAAHVIGDAAPQPTSAGMVVVPPPAVDQALVPAATPTQPHRFLSLEFSDPPEPVLDAGFTTPWTPVSSRRPAVVSRHFEGTVRVHDGHGNLLMPGPGPSSPADRPSKVFSSPHNIHATYVTSAAVAGDEERLQKADVVLVMPFFGDRSMATRVRRVAVPLVADVLQKQQLSHDGCQQSNPAADHDVLVVVPQLPTLGSREHPAALGHAEYAEAADSILVAGLQQIEETRALLAMFHAEHPQRRLVISGISMGGSFASSIAYSPLPFPVGLAALCPSNGAAFPFADGILRLYVDWSQLSRDELLLALEPSLADFVEARQPAVHAATLPAEFVFGLHDHFIPASNLQSLLELFPNHRIQWLPGGHAACIGFGASLVPAIQRVRARMQ